MSAIYFHSPSAEMRLHGAERAYLGSLTHKLALGLLDVGGHGTANQLNRFVSTSHYLAQMDPKAPMWIQSYETAFRVGMTSGLITWCGHEIDPFIVALNTALMVGNDQIKLAARLHGQCEIHVWIEGEDRQWLAGIISKGVETGIYRKEMGWEAIVEFLEDRNDEPVITHYSVCDSAINPANVLDSEKPQISIAAGNTDDTSDSLYDWWNTLTNEQQWEKSMAYHRTVSPQLSPGRWDYPDYHFTEGVTVFDLLAKDYGPKLRALYDAAGHTGSIEDTTEKETTDA